MRHLLLLLFLLPLCLHAQVVDNCLAGQWQLDDGRSDNPEKVLKKLLRQQKMDERYQANPYQKAENKQPEPMPRELPEFVFNKQALTLTFSDAYVDISQAGKQRHLRLDGKPAPISLAQLAQSPYTEIAGWEAGQLVVETTMANGWHIIERVVVADGLLKIHYRIGNGIGEPHELDKYYRPSAPLTCSPL